MDDLNSLWNRILTDIKKEVSEANYVTLFKKTSLISLEDNTASIAAPSTIIIDMLEKRFFTLIKSALDSHTGKEMSVFFVPKVIITDKQTGKKKEAPLFDETPGQQTDKPVNQMLGHLPRVRQEYTFSNFAVSSTNQLAFASAETVSKNIGRIYNPLFLYGPVGVGKTHLMHAVANFVYQYDPTKKIIYITSEEFTNEVVEAIRNNETAKMKRRFRSAFLLLIDDIQFIEGKDKVQEELFHTFNILIDNGSQIILSSDRPPHEIKKLEKRLSSRFAGGLTVDIGIPDMELKAAILRIKSSKYGYDLPVDVAVFLAENASDSRSLEGLLLRVITQAATSHVEITHELAKKAMFTSIQESRQSLHSDDVINNVCTYFQVKSTAIRGPKRDASLVRARQVAMYLLKELLGLTTVEIGNILGGRDHTTVMYGVDKMEKLVNNKDKVAMDIVGIKKLLSG